MTEEQWKRLCETRAVETLTRELEFLIHLTPTGEARNLLTEMNIRLSEYKLLRGF